MEDKDFDLLKESLQQAIDFKKGKRKVARSTIRGITVPEYGSNEVLSIRLKLELTQHGLASILGVSPRTVEAWESGANRPNGSARKLLYLLNKDENILSLLTA